MCLSLAVEIFPDTFGYVRVSLTVEIFPNTFGYVGVSLAVEIFPDTFGYVEVSLAVEIIPDTFGYVEVSLAVEIFPDTIGYVGVSLAVEIFPDTFGYVEVSLAVSLTNIFPDKYSLIGYVSLSQYSLAVEIFPDTFGYVLVTLTVKLSPDTFGYVGVSLTVGYVGVCLAVEIFPDTFGYVGVSLDVEIFPDTIGYEWSTFLDQLVIIPIVITGDLNFHLDDKNNSDACKFIETLEDHGLQQHINGPTHIHGHTLDVIITREISSILKNTPVVHDPYLCDKKGNPAGDHMALFAQLRISRPSKYRQTVTYRKYRDINLDDIKNDFVESIPPVVNATEPVDSLVSLYNTNLISDIDKHAPIVSKEITLRPNTEWHTEELRDAKRNCRKAERRMQKTNLTVHQQIHRDACVHANKLLIRCRKEHFSTKGEEAEHDQKQLFRLSKHIMGEKQETILPSHKDEKDLANKFCQFFMNKIEMIRANLSASNKRSITMCDIMKSDEKFNGEHLSSFKPTTITELTKIIQSAPSKHCELDPMPTYLLKSCSNELLPVMTNIVNCSLSESLVPSSFEQAIVRPLLKKPSLDREVFKNYRPVSNLPFLSKVLEKVVSSRLEHHIESNNLHENLQSAYRARHSTETALLRVHHDIVSALDKNSCVVLLMLDLSAAFDVIDHKILLERLNYSFGVSDSVLSWIESYLKDRTQRVAIGTKQSDDLRLQYGVPQGSVLGPKLYCMYSKPVGEICRRHKILYHSYADDTQAYQVIKPEGDWDDLSDRLKACLSQISDWMTSNMLKLNQDKTELIVFAPKHRVKQLSKYELPFDGTFLSDANCVRNLGVFFDKTLSMEQQVSDTGSLEPLVKALHDKAPKYLEELIVPYAAIRTLRSENEGLITKPRDVRTKTYGERRFDRAGASLWNDLPIHLRKEQSLPRFKKGLKTHIFRLAYCDV
ncbi:unnamed protein product [Mytilus coruscus]|uniref:Reverse transcriptase domain-containing protein n=1 Tax=Mytilus coruscus TaxID=42192 RepID=A0A6J8EQN5_MYTCO|nr:unnamed protein product [Mytilus coruscus]